ncbi:unnamed protein product (mitochondrion) [Plasmodiophora brassicae]|uniref:Protein kinase domain-containing protein n=1 Tax=Plasmodiophora brassicae TaxID=37360 RepID=A0A0G4J825_PLABS|nr:hypothetical protein PBRA_003317 [Plasmodiophora brassicae]SPQ99672.1 unnamed protein product [Plasmodiophora brassicae]
MKVACVLTSLCLTVVLSMVVPGHGTPDPAQKQRDRREFDEIWSHRFHHFIPRRVPLSHHELIPAENRASVVPCEDLSWCYNNDDEILCIGRGTFGEVLQGRYGEFDVAVKVFPSVSSRGELNGFTNELTMFMTLARLQNVIPFVGFTLLRDRRPAIVMSLASRGCLRRMLKKRSVPLSTRLEWAADACDAIAEMHSNGYAHGDVKTGNILIGYNGDGLDPQGFIADLGAACKVEDKSRFWRSHMTCTVNYAAPEQLALTVGKSDPWDEACDTWSLGAVAISSILQKEWTPFPGNQPDAQASYYEHVCVKKNRPTLPPGKVSDTLDMVINQCLSFIPSQRPPAKLLSIALRREATLPGH